MQIDAYELKPIDVSNNGVIIKNSIVKPIKILPCTIYIALLNLWYNLNFPHSSHTFVKPLKLLYLLLIIS